MRRTAGGRKSAGAGRSRLAPVIGIIASFCVVLLARNLGNLRLIMEAGSLKKDPLIALPAQPAVGQSSPLSGQEEPLDPHSQKRQQTRPPRMYPEDSLVDVGFVSTRPAEFFHDLQRQVDEDDNVARCSRYGYTYTAHDTMPELLGNPRALLPREKWRRIFYGSLTASEPWELYEIVGAEVYGLFEAMVFVEANLTQMANPRNFTHLEDAETLADIYGVPVSRVQVRPFVNQNLRIRGLEREHLQRAEILRGWKELGMTPDDIGYLADADETFTRDFLRAIQVCDRIPELDYDFHRCHHEHHGVRAFAMSFETSPECATQVVRWFHPDMYVGACIEGIGNETVHPLAPREANSFIRQDGYARPGFEKMGVYSAKRNYPLSNAADFRRLGAGRHSPVIPYLVHTQQYSPYTGFHFHNFFVQSSSVRWKYSSYGHVSWVEFPFFLSFLFNNDLASVYFS
jgi:Glycosyltransferase family 17